MTLRMPGVPYVGPPSDNWGGKVIRPPMGLVVHIAEGSFDGTIAWQRNPASNVSSHFIAGRDGRLVQMLDADVAAWTQAAGNPTWISVENEGFNTQPFTDAQIDANARIFAWIREVWPSIPPVVTNSPSVPGLGWHGMGGVAWGNHPNCPGAVNVALLPTILARATGQTTGDPDMLLIQTSGSPDIFVFDGTFRTRIESPTQSAEMQAAGVKLIQVADLGQYGVEFSKTEFFEMKDLIFGLPDLITSTCTGSGGGGGGASPDQVRDIVRDELDQTHITSVPGTLTG